MTRREAKAARRRKRTQGVRVTPLRLHRREDGSWEFVPRKVRGPESGPRARASGRAFAIRLGGLKLAGEHPTQVAERKRREAESAREAA